jgi:hypothetical protein
LLLELSAIKFAVRRKEGRGAGLRGIGASGKSICENALPLYRPQPTNPMHGLTAAIDEGICPKILAQ